MREGKKRGKERGEGGAVEGEEREGKRRGRGSG